MKNLLMILGVVEIEDDVRALGAEPLDYNRTPDYKIILENIFKGLQYVHQTKRPVLLVSSSGTGVMEGAVTNVMNRNSEALYVNGGVFGERWGLILKQHGIKAHEIKLNYGETINPQIIKDYLDKNRNIEAVFLTHNETSTGTKTDIKAIAEIIKKYPNTILVVDCISSILVEDIKTDEWGIDVIVSSGNKALAVPPGVGFMTFSEKAMKKVEKSDLRLFNYDAIEYTKEWERTSTPYTPPISILKQLELRLKKIQTEGLENVRKRYENNTQYLRDGVKNLGLGFFTKHPANCVTGVVTPENINAGDVVRLMREKHHIELAPSWPGLKEKLFRVGNYGNINKPEIDRFLNALKLTIDELRG